MWEKGNTVETVVILSKLKTKRHVDIEIHTDELDLTSAESKATYAELKQYVLDKYGLKVSSLNIARLKQSVVLSSVRIIIRQRTKMLSSQTAQRKKKMQ